MQRFKEVGKVKRRGSKPASFQKRILPLYGKEVILRFIKGEGLINSLRFVLCVIWSILLITLSLMVYLFTFRSAIPVAMARKHWAPGVLKIYGIRLTISGANKLKTESSYVFVSNHQSFLDIPILFYAVPVNLYFVAKKELKFIPFLGWYMMATGMIFIDRSNRARSIESLNRAAGLIHDGKSVLMFPEGTRNAGNDLHSFKKGPFLLARSAEVQVVPVGIGAGQINTGKGWSSQVAVHFGTPQNSTDMALTDLILFAQREVGKLSGKGSDRQSPRIANG